MFRRGQADGDSPCPSWQRAKVHCSAFEKDLFDDNDRQLSTSGPWYVVRIRPLEFVTRFQSGQNWFLASTRGSTVAMPADSNQTIDKTVQGLRQLQLLPEYRSDANDVVREFYEPCLERCQLYRRAVGYFTSSGLAAAARGITPFIAGSGTMQLVASPAIAPDDQDAIKRGYEARRDAIAKSLLRELAKAEDAATRDRLGYLAWLIAEERLEIQIALPVAPNGELRDGIYHEKLGIFEDALNDRVAFSGSANETAGGLVDNFESIDVFWSWDDHHGRVARKLANFDRLWKNETNGVEIYEFPDAVKKQLLTLKPASHPGKPPPQPVPPVSNKWRHQDEAVAAFLARECGVLEMATGTGKTRTALRIVKTLIEKNQIDSVIIAVDGNDLLDQWYLQIAPLCGLLSPPFAAVRNYGTHKERDQFVLDPKNMMKLEPNRGLIASRCGLTVLDKRCRFLVFSRKPAEETGRSQIIFLIRGWENTDLTPETDSQYGEHIVSAMGRQLALEFGRAFSEKSDANSRRRRPKVPVYLSPMSPKFENRRCQILW
jgi:hypothetical protein